MGGNEVSLQRARKEVAGEYHKRMPRYSWNPQYVNYNGQIYHLARFLSIQEGKMYCPSASRGERWKSSNTTSYYEKLTDVSEVHRENGFLCVGDFGRFWLDGDYVYGKIVRIDQKYSSQSSYVVFEVEQSKLVNIYFSIKLYKKQNGGKKLTSTEIQYDYISGKALIFLMKRRLS